MGSGGCESLCPSLLPAHLRHLSLAEVKDLLAEELQDGHAVLTQCLIRPAGIDQVRDEALPLGGPVLQRVPGNSQVCSTVNRRGCGWAYVTTPASVCLSATAGAGGGLLTCHPGDVHMHTRAGRACNAGHAQTVYLSCLYTTHACAHMCVNKCVPTD